mmetsp:Transcript_80895/g.232427  ORF Transcript_80895/g.232427 Transcript_80895/m.232427 type:complete len:280 (-) Transcript_80895:810-1649(-)
MAHVGSLRLLDGIAVAVNDEVEVAHCNPGHLLEAFEVEAQRWSHTRCVQSSDARRFPISRHAEGGQCERSEVADRHLVRGAELHHLRAQVRATKSTQVLLIGLSVHGVLVQHIGHPSFHLRLQNSEPQCPGRHRALAQTCHLHPLVQLLELLAPQGLEALRRVHALDARGAEQGPLGVSLDAAHEQVGDPQAIEQVAGSAVLASVVPPQLEEVENVSMPGFQVGSKCTFPLAATLVRQARALIEHPHHRKQALRAAVVAVFGASGRQTSESHSDASSGC